MRKQRKTQKEGLNQKIQTALSELAHEHFGSFLEDGPYDRWSGIMGMTEKELPLYGKTMDGIYYLAGFSGHGMGLSFLTSRLLVQLLLKQDYQSR
jgi:gamma-glutamylputrescine oxidase